jgi:hypothetical protein
MLAEAHPVTVEALPAPGLTAYAAVEQLPADDGDTRDRVDRTASGCATTRYGSAPQRQHWPPWTAPVWPSGICAGLPVPPARPARVTPGQDPNGCCPTNDHGEAVYYYQATVHLPILDQQLPAL